VSNTIIRPRKILVAFVGATFLGECCTWADYSFVEKPKMGELQMYWLRSEDLKEEKNVTAPLTIIAVKALYRCPVEARRTMGHAPNKSRF